MPSSEAGLDLDEEEEAQAPQAIESSFSPIQFKQLSVGKSFSCGIQHMDGKIRCWGTLKGVLRDTDLIESQAPYRQVSVGPHGVCMISEGTNAATCLGVSPLPSNEWDQLKVGKSHVCGVTMDSELKCSGPPHVIVNSLRDDFVVA
jgi:alpha-tubulin suppressor-like RCC1 family protein